MRGSELFLLAVGAVVLTGCRKPVPREDFSLAYELKTELVCDHHWTTIRRLIIRGQGSRTVEMGDWGTQGYVDLSGGTEPAYEVLLVAMFAPGDNSLTCWITGFGLKDGKRVYGGGGLPRMFRVKPLPQCTLRNIIQWNEVSGRLAYGEVVSLGSLLMDIPYAPKLTLVVK